MGHLSYDRWWRFRVHTKDPTTSLSSQPYGGPSAWSFVRSFGSIWNVAIPAAVFNDLFQQLSYHISDLSTRGLLSAGRAYLQVSAEIVNWLPPILRNQIVGVYIDSLKLVWQVLIVFSGVSFLLVLLEKQVKLRTELDTEYRLEEKKQQR